MSHSEAFRRTIVRAVRLVPIALVLVATMQFAAAAHEHMPIASTAPGGGSRVLAHDFSRQSVASRSGAGEYTGDDPGFNALLADDAADSLYQVKDGTRVSVLLVARDPEVTMAVGGNELEKPGDKVQIGTMPYLHVDVLWTLTLPPGVTGFYQVAFRITASGYGQSAVYTDTVTNIVPVTTTTTVAVDDAATTSPGRPATTTTVEAGGTTSTTVLTSGPGGSTPTSFPAAGVTTVTRARPTSVRATPAIISCLPGPRRSPAGST